MDQIGCEGALRPYLQDGESLLWVGKPGTGLKLRPSDKLFIPFSLMWGGFAIFWEANVLRNDNVFFILWGVPFVAIGLYIMIGRFFWDAYVRGRQVYGVTNHRLLIKTDFPHASLKSFALATLPNLSLEERPDFSGSISFGHRSEDSSEGHGAFEFLEKVRAVYDTIVAAQNSLRAPLLADSARSSELANFTGRQPK